ncbi:PilZ domain-containing protein [Paradevosia shaoguanensis]|uniref:PilZ domain-containing protein n=1 Tax=Paradevosia shaoguanensis TaxID=1335043 RepID=UPI0019335D9D|nr:PilZ domain-containing protein [Paradevosia shaoguanensis]
MSVAVNATERTADTTDIRFVGVLSGCYTLSNKRDGLTGALKVFACRTQSISPDRLVLDGALFGAAGDRVALKLEEVGLLRGVVDRVLATGLAIDLHLDPEERVKLAGKLAWIKKRRFKHILDKRAYPRWFPRNPRTNIIFADGEKLDAFIIDLSRSGVAISAEVKPALGTPMAVGHVLGRVVRHLEHGFAVGFAALHEEKGIEDELTTLLLGSDEARLANLKTYSAILSVVP